MTTFAHKDLADYYLRIEHFSKAEESYLKAIQVLDDVEMIGQKRYFQFVETLECVVKREGTLTRLEEYWRLEEMLPLTPSREV